MAQKHPSHAANVHSTKSNGKYEHWCKNISIGSNFSLDGHALLGITDDYLKNQAGIEDERKRLKVATVVFFV
jgi:hypothetical protein